MASRGIQSLLKAFVDAASRSAASVPPIAIRSLPGTPASACATDSIFLRLKVSAAHPIAWWAVGMLGSAQSLLILMQVF